MIDTQPQNRSSNNPRIGTRAGCPARSTRGRLRVLLASSLLLMDAMIPGISIAQEDSAGEYELKAAMLYNLTRFVEWPSSSYPDPQAPIVLCVLGRDPFGTSLTSTVLNKTVDGRSVRILHPQNGTESRVCQVLYIGSSQRKTTAEIFSILNGFSVLTVGETTQFAAQGGMVQFSMEDQQVHFQINLDVASRAGLKISAKLLALAHIVKA